MIARLDSALLSTLTIVEPLADIDPQSLADELERTWARVWVVTQEKNIVSALITWFVADEVHIINMSTALSQKRKGYARALMQTLMREASAANVRIVVLEVRKSNAPAIALYRAFGFEVTGERRAYYRDGEDALDMTCDLSSCEASKS